APRAGIDRVNIVVRGGDDELPCRRARWAPIERLGIEMTRDLWMKTRVEMGAAGALPGQCRHDVIAAAIRGAVVGQHRLALRGPTDRKPEEQGAAADLPWPSRFIPIASP